MKKYLRIILIIALIAASISTAYAWVWTVNFCNVPPTLLNFGSPLPTYPNVNSKWEQPRSVGTNPHQGVDLAATDGTSVYAVYYGWFEALSGDQARLYVDANRNQVKDTGDYYIYYYHVNNKESNGYKNKGNKIAESYYPSAPHLHFGYVDSNGDWGRNEVNYRWTSNWNYGKDLDSFSRVEWNSGKAAGITAYFKDENGTYTPGEVRIFHRVAGTSTWTDGGTMTAAGSYKYTYDFSNNYSSGTTIQWMVRIKRNGLSVYSYAWAPAKFDEPDTDPNRTAYIYAYYTNTLNY